jgi:hypothetical protein
LQWISSRLSLASVTWWSRSGCTAATMCDVVEQVCNGTLSLTVLLHCCVAHRRVRCGGVPRGRIWQV